jgi:transcriptional regulator with XRE-family HTH domain
MPARSTGGDALSRTLRELREAAGFRQVDAAERAGVSQALIARFETGRQVPRPDQVERLCDAYGVFGDARRAAVEMASDARAGTERVVMHRTVQPAQARINRIAKDTRRERTFSPSGLPGLLQTADYARAVFRAEPNLTEEAVERALAERLAGQQILDSTDHEFGFVIPEGALGWALVPPAAMAEQLEHVARSADKPNLQLGIITWGSTTPVLPLNSFTLFDDRLVIVGTTTRVAYLIVRAELDAYHRLYEQLAGYAVYGDQALDIVGRTADRYHQLAKSCGRTLGEG